MTLLLPLPRNQHRRLEPNDPAALVEVARWLDGALRQAERGRDAGLAHVIDKWRDAGGDLSDLPQALSNDALIEADDEIERIRESCDADLRRRMAREMVDA